MGGHVISDQGVPISDARVMILDGPTPYPDIAALTNNRGWFQFDNLCPGSYTILVNIDDCEPATVTVTVKEQESVEQEIRIFCPD